MKRILAVAATVLMAFMAPAAASAAAPAATVECGPLYSYTNADSGYGYIPAGTYLKDGPYSACGDGLRVSGSTKVWFWCWVDNSYGNEWVYARIDGTQDYGWVYLGTLTTYTTSPAFASC